MKRNEKGITLIALIITVIILLILAGTAISIAINGGDVFSKSSDAREQWNNAVELEDSSLKDSLYVLDMAANPDLAKAKLTVKVNEDDTVDSPYYVNYPSAKGTIKCRVLYNDSTYGLQLVSVDPVEKLSLTSTDIETAQNLYNNIITTLNEKAEEYMETEDGNVLAIDARCVGSDPLNKNHPENLTGNERAEKMFIADETYDYMTEYNGKFFDSDNYHAKDISRLRKINALKYNDTTNGIFYFLGVHYIRMVNSEYWFGPLLINSSRYITAPSNMESR